MQDYKKKLIEVALPLSEINDASSYDKMPGIGPHPKGIHHWWARLPLPTARAVLFASVIDDPSSNPEKFPTEASQKAERERLFNIIRRMMQKKLHEHPEVYEEAQQEMLKHCNGKLPPVLDPFAGGGSIPLEANRLGFEAHAADLNPVAVLLNKCNLEIIPRWNNCPPINLESRNNTILNGHWKGAQGLAEDVRYYGRRIREKAIEKIGHLYPKVKLPREYAQFAGQETNVIAWLWARTVASPNPAAQGVHVPLIRSFWLSTKKGKESYISPIIDKIKNQYCFQTAFGKPESAFKPQNGTVKKTGAKCLLHETPIDFKYIRKEGKKQNIKYKMMAIVADLSNGRTYISPNNDQEKIANVELPSGYPDSDLPEKALGFRVQLYGMNKHYKCFHNRQLTAMITLSDLIKEQKKEILSNGIDAGLNNKLASTYADSILTFLSLALDRCADFNNALCRWKPSGEQTMQLFARQAIPMVWDFAEPNILGEKAICWRTSVDICANSIEKTATKLIENTDAQQIDAAAQSSNINNVLISTDPPYYDNIGYASLSDFFYIWLRRTIGELYPELFGTILVPKNPELTAAPEIFEGNKQKAKEHFESGFKKTFSALKIKMAPSFPLTVYYAFKQEDEEAYSTNLNETSNSKNGIDRNTGWETLLAALISSGFEITATWPVRASQKWRIRSLKSNALASYIVLACRPRPSDATQCSRREFLMELKHELPISLKHLQQGNIAPVDLAQASIGPGMAIFSRYSQVIESSGDPMTIRTALSLINQTLDEVLTEQEGEFDADTRWAVAWFEQHGMEEGPFGEANVLCQAKNTAVNGLVDAGILYAKGGLVRLLNRTELKPDWDPALDKRLTFWETTQYLIKSLEEAGEQGTAQLLKKLGTTGEIARELAYRLFKICERKGMSQEAQAYNGLVISWPEISRIASAPEVKPESEQISFL